MIIFKYYHSQLYNIFPLMTFIVFLNFILIAFPVSLYLLRFFCVLLIVLKILSLQVGSNTQIWQLSFPIYIYYISAELSHLMSHHKFLYLFQLVSFMFLVFPFFLVIISFSFNSCFIVVLWDNYILWGIDVHRNYTQYYLDLLIKFLLNRIHIYLSREYDLWVT